MRLDDSLASVVEDLTYAFDGVFSQETVAREVADARALLPELEAAGGTIVNVTSIAGSRVHPFAGVAYAASKAGILALTRSFARELAPHGVTVNAVAPSAVRSPLLDALGGAARAALAAAIPLGRFGEAHEVAAAVVYLASPAGAYITGATLDLNGGRLMR